MSRFMKLGRLDSAPAKVGAVLGLSLALALGCGGTPPPEEPPPPPPSVSLLTATPLVGDEAEPRDPAPGISRLFLDEESVAGWAAPPEGVLRFPVELRSGARFCFRLGAKTDVSLSAGDLGIRMEYRPESSGSSQTSDGFASRVAFEATTEQLAQCFETWYQADVSLGQWAPSRGEIALVVDGPMAGDPGIKVIWGAPAIYHPNERRHRNVLLIGVDTLRADAVTPYGARAEVTPNLETYSESGTLFTQARAQSSWTLTSFASMITGELPSIVGATIYSGHIPERATTLGEILLPLGYATETVCSNAWLGNDDSGFHQGMEGLWYRYDASAQASVDKALEFVARSIGRDWFCFLHFIDPHVPYDPPEHFVNLLCDPNYNGPHKKAFHAIEEWKSGAVYPPEEDIKQARDLYDGESANVDAALGTLFTFLDAYGLLEDTLIVFASDHGEEFYEHGAFEHGHTQFEDQVWMPLMVWGRGFPGGERIDTPVGNIDIPPTILRFIDLPIPDWMTGIPLQEAAAGNEEIAAQDRIIFGEGNNRGTERKFAVQWPYKCILDFVTGEVLLFDISSDPGETQDLSGEYPEIVQKLSRAMVAAMLPEEDAFHVWIMASHGEDPLRFTGELRVPGGIERVQAFSLEEGDKYTHDRDTVSFDILSTLPAMQIDKHLMIIPVEGAETLEARVRVDGQISPDRFYPYGTLEPEPTGFASVHMDDYPLGPDLAAEMAGMPAVCYIWGVRGFSRGEIMAELDPETTEQLRALGYIN